MRRTSLWLVPGCIVVLGALGLSPVAQAESTGATGGSVVSTSRPEIGNKLLLDGMLPLAVGGAQIKALNIAPVQESLRFPITGGTVDPQARFAGELTTSGGIKFPRLWCLCSVTMSDMKIVLSADPHVTATLNGDSTQQVRLFDLDLAQMDVDGTAGNIHFTNMQFRMAEQGAQVLNQDLGTDVFVTGDVFGDAAVSIEYDA